MRLFLIYAAGNFIEATADTPFLQIGEHKYGKPILDRVIRPDTPIDDAVKAVLVSMDSTLRSNLSVGMPLDLCVIPVDTMRAQTQRIESDHKEFRQISDSWAASLNLDASKVQVGAGRKQEFVAGCNVCLGHHDPV